VNIKWNTHSVCWPCWEKRSGRKPVRLKEEYRDQEPCCFCGEMHKSGIYLRESTDQVKCNDRGPVHAQD
jgi:hypothetical protein